eukprot:1136345-Pelagomonas_calceolata.AAC.5
MTNANKGKNGSPHLCSLMGKYASHNGCDLLVHIQLCERGGHEHGKGLALSSHLHLAANQDEVLHGIVDQRVEEGMGRLPLLAILQQMQQSK